MSTFLNGNLHHKDALSKWRDSRELRRFNIYADASQCTELRDLHNNPSVTPLSIHMSKSTVNLKHSLAETEPCHSGSLILSGLLMKEAQMN